MVSRRNESVAHFVSNWLATSVVWMPSFRSVKNSVARSFTLAAPETDRLEFVARFICGGQPLTSAASSLPTVLEQIRALIVSGQLGSHQFWYSQTSSKGTFGSSSSDALAVIQACTIPSVPPHTARIDTGRNAYGVAACEVPSGVDFHSRFLTESGQLCFLLTSSEEPKTNGAGYSARL